MNTIRFKKMKTKMNVAYITGHIFSMTETDMYIIILTDHKIKCTVQHMLGLQWAQERAIVQALESNYIIIINSKCLFNSPEAK